MKTILVPLDGSSLARQVLPLATKLAGVFSSELVLLNVTAPHGGHRDDERRQQIDSQATAQLNDDIADYMPMLKEHGASVRPLLVEGSVAEGIVNTAEVVNADLIAMTTHGYTGMRRWALGSITDKVVQTTKTPLLVVRGKDSVLDKDVDLKCVMVTLDSSDLARQALPIATEIAAKTGAELLLLSVIPPRITDVMRDLTDTRWTSEEMASAKSELMAEVEPYAETLSKGNVKVTPLVVEGFVADTISVMAKQHNVDLLVMSTHGYSAALRWALGSIANKVLQSSDVPLLLVRAQDGSADA